MERIPIGTKVVVKSPESFHHQDWGIVCGFDGELYHVAMFGGYEHQPVFSPSELRYLGRPRITRKQAASALGKIKSESKAAAARANGKLGGRPRSKTNG